MRLLLTEEQTLLQQSVAAVTGPHVGQAYADRSRGSDALLEALAENGFVGALVSEDRGGAGLGPLELCLLTEQLGPTLATFSFCHLAAGSFGLSHAKGDIHRGAIESAKAIIPAFQSNSTGPAETMRLPSTILRVQGALERKRCSRRLRRWASSTSRQTLSARSHSFLRR